MTLVVEFSEFASSARRYGAGADNVIYLKPVADSVHLTYVNPASKVQIVSFYVGTEESAKKQLEADGFTTARGTWVTEASLEHLARVTGDAYIAAVAYQTPAGPGLWMDSSPTPPLESTVLKAIFHEFVDEGLLGDDQYEAFIEQAAPIVRILSPEDIQTFLRQKQT